MHAAAHGVADAAREFAAFADYHRARGSTMADWDAAWRTWVRNAVAFAARDRRSRERGGGQYLSAAEKSLQGVDALREWARERDAARAADGGPA